MTFHLKFFQKNPTTAAAAMMCLILSLWGAVEAKALKWKTFTEKQGGFSVLIPDLKVTPGGSDNSWVVQVNDKDGQAEEVYNFDFSVEDFSKGGQDQILKGDIESIRQLSHPDSIEQKDATYQGYTCRQYDYVEPQGPDEAIRHIRRIIMTKNRVFVLDYMRIARDFSDSPEKVSELKTGVFPNAQKFLDSFKINPKTI